MYTFFIFILGVKKWGFRPWAKIRGYHRKLFTGTLGRGYGITMELIEKGNPALSLLLGWDKTSGHVMTVL